VQALKEWHEFYVLVGTAGATLLALLFVAVSLGTGFLSHKDEGGTRTFMSPVVIHFTSVFFICAVGLMPALPPLAFGGLIAATALLGLIVSAVTATRLLGDMTHDLEDRLAYGLLPALTYFVVLAAAALIADGIEWSLLMLAGGLLALIIVNIRNVWDLTLAMVRHPDRTT
jgi:hypothetical protein